MCIITIWHLTCEHIKKVGSVVPVRQRSNRVFAIAKAIPACDNRWKYCCQADRTSTICFGGVVTSIGIKRGEGRNGCAQYIHWSRRFGEQSHQIAYRTRKCTVSTKLRTHIFKLLFSR